MEKHVKRVIICYLMVLIFISVNLGSSNTNGIVREEKSNNIKIEVEWNHTFGTVGDRAWFFIQTTDGGYAISGITESSGAGGKDGWLVKTDANGQPEWNHTFGGINNEEFGSLIQTADGGFVIAGSTESYGAGASDGWLLKTNSTGHAEWNQTYGGANNDGVGSIVQTSDGGFVIAGSTESYGAGAFDFWLFKTNSTGNVEWNHTYGGINEEDCCAGLIQTADGKFVIAGSSVSFPPPPRELYDWNFWLIKTDINGIPEWNNSFAGSYYLTSLIQTEDEGYVLAGQGVDLVKTNSSGQVEWNHTFGGNVNSVIQTTDGGLAMAGVSDSYGTGGAGDGWLVKTDANGQAEWNTTFGGSELDSFSSVIQTADGGYVLLGWTETACPPCGNYLGVNLLKILVSNETTTTSSATTTTTSSSTWSPLVALMSLAVLIYQKRRKNFKQ